MFAGPNMFSGGISTVTRQYASERFVIWILLMYGSVLGIAIFSITWLEMHESNEKASQGRSHERPNDRHRRVAPPRSCFLAERQERMRDARTQIARWIDGVPGGPSQRQTNRPHQHAHQIRAQVGGRTTHRGSPGKDGSTRDYKHEGTDD